MYFCVLLLFILNPNFNLAETCPNGDEIYSVGVTQEEKEDILELHNEDRLKIAHGELPDQPSGKDLKRMKYDEKLAELAGIVNMRCRFAHFRVRDRRWPYVGQNLYKEYSYRNTSERHWKQAIDAWFNEHDHYNYPVGSTNAKMVTHYTQVVWSNTTHVGCDFVHFFNSSDTIRPYTKMYTCHYGPSGNRRGRPPYKAGTAKKCLNLC